MKGRFWGSKYVVAPIFPSIFLPFLFTWYWETVCLSLDALGGMGEVCREVLQEEMDLQLPTRGAMQGLVAFSPYPRWVKGVRCPRRR